MSASAPMECVAIQSLINAKISTSVLKTLIFAKMENASISLTVVDTGASANKASLQIMT